MVKNYVLPFTFIPDMFSTIHKLSSLQLRFQHITSNTKNLTIKIRRKNKGTFITKILVFFGPTIKIKE